MTGSHPKKLSLNVKMFPRYLSHFRLNLLLSIILYKIYGFPRISVENLAVGIGNNGPRSIELARCAKFPIKLNRIQKLVVVTAIILVIKNLLFPYYIVSSINNLMSDSARQAPNTKTLKFSCLETNCTDETSLAKLIKLPVFPICQPELSTLLTPVIGLKVFGLSLQTLYTTYIFIMNVILVLELYRRPTCFEMLIFMFAPNVVKSNRHEEIRGNIVKVGRSIRDASSREGERTYLSSKETNERRVNLNQRSLRSRSVTIWRPGDEELEYNSRFEVSFENLDPNGRAFVSDCMTIFRDEDWAVTINRLCSLSVLVFGSLGLMGFGLVTFIVPYLSVLAADEAQLLLDSITKTSHCAVWLTGHDINSGVPIEPVQFRPIGFIELIVMNTMTIIMTASTISKYHIAICEINAMIAEQMDRAQVAVEISEIISRLGLEASQSTRMERDFDKYADLYNFEPLHELLRTKIKVGPALTFLEPSRLHKNGDCWFNDALSHIALDMISVHGVNMYSYACLLIKIHTGNFLLMRLVNELSGTFEKLLLLSILVNFSNIVSAIYFDRKLKELSSLLILYALLGVLFNSALTIYPSTVNALSRKMLMLMWRLVNATTSFQDTRVKQVRSLLLRQIVFLNQNGGLTFKAFGMSVTYATVIKLALWSSTLVVVSFNL